MVESHIAKSNIDLSGFIGTENWYTHGLVKSVTFTDGVKYFAEQVGAFWFIDLMAIEVYWAMKQHGFLSITLDVKNEGATISVDDGNGNVIFTRSIEYTDCPSGQYQFYFTNNVLMLTSEY